MDWQDELRRLDKQLSEGEISAQDYRRLRDELLAEASAPAQGRGSLWTSARPDVTPEPAPPPSSPDAEDTQVVADSTVVVQETVVNGKPVGEAVVRDKAAVSDTPAEDPDRTERVAAETVAAGTAAGSGRKLPTFPPRPVDGPMPKAPPLPAPAPWTGKVLGEEVFADAKPQSGARRAVTILLSLVVVLAIAGGAVWFFAFRSDEEAPAARQPDNPPASNTPQSEASQPAPSAPQSAVPDNRPANLADVVGPLPGAADENNGTISPARAGQLKLISPQEVAAAEDAGVEEVIFRGSTSGTVGNALLVLATPDGTAAGELATAERRYLRENGFDAGKELRGGLPVLVREDDVATVYRVVYTTGKYTVRFGVAQRDANPVQLRQELEAVADTILAVLPPS